MKKSREIPLAFGAVSIAAIVFASAADLPPVLVWNGSASAPLGLYRIDYRPPKVGDFVLVRPNNSLEKFITERGYLPKDIPLLKRVAAQSGAEICRKNLAISIDGILVAEALSVDSQARILPQWSGCFSLKSDEIFLLNAPERSLDGRYFGATKLGDVVGVAIPVWVRE